MRANPIYQVKNKLHVSHWYIYIPISLLNELQKFNLENFGSIVVISTILVGKKVIDTVNCKILCLHVTCLTNRNREYLWFVRYILLFAICYKVCHFIIVSHTSVLTVCPFFTLFFILCSTSLLRASVCNVILCLYLPRANVHCWQIFTTEKRFADLFCFRHTSKPFRLFIA